MKAGNFFVDAGSPEAGEWVDRLCGCRNVRIERISSAAGLQSRSYDQEQDEWVMLLEGKARLEVDGEVVDLAPGDYLYLPAHTPHKVLSTLTAPRCLWLAVHVD